MEQSFYPERVKKSRSVYQAIVLPMILVILAMMLFLLLAVWSSGIFARLDQNARDILDQRVINRKDYLQNYMVSEWSDLTMLANTVNRETGRLIAEGELSLDTLDDSADSANPLLLAVLDDLIAELRAKRTSGIYLILNTASFAPDASTGEFDAKPGIYIRDRDPMSFASLRNEDLTLLRASTTMVQRMSITMDEEWRPMFTFDESAAGNNDFFARPYQTAYETPGIKNASDFGYWSIAPFGDKDETPFTISYSVPLILDSGEVYGVLGVDVTQEYLKDMLPFDELDADGESAYLLTVVDLPEDMLERTAFMENPKLTPLLLAAPSDSDLSLSLAKSDGFDITHSGDDGSYHYYMGGEEYYVSLSSFTLYSRNAPFETQTWMLAGIVRSSRLFHFSRAVRISLGFALVGSIIAGLIFILVIGRSTSNAIRTLSEEVEEAQRIKGLIPKLSKTGITEIDAFSEAITSLSRDALNASLKEQRRIERERDYDFLTGLMNRRAYHRMGQMLFLEPEKMKTAAMVMLDLDNLKVINDRYGHDWGDQYIHQAAECFTSAVPASTVVARVSGDEFFMLFYGYEDKAEIRAHIRALFRKIEESDFPLPHEKKDRIRVSGGVAWYPDNSRDFNELMTLADFAMYHAKVSGKGQFAEFDEEVFKKHNQTLQGLEELDELLHSRELMTYYFQPIIDAKTGETYAYEALMRVTMTNLRGPEAVLKYARQERRLHEVERMTWNRALACYRMLLDNSRVAGNALLFINSIASQFLREEEVKELAARYEDLLPKVVIEITEAEDMPEEALEAKRKIPYFSGKFALDDYGTGYNTDMMLFQLNPAYVKVDISFVQGIDTNPDTQRLVKNLVEYAHEREMLVIAEGIETEAELTKLLELDVDLLQGFYLAMPEPVVTDINPKALEVIREYRGR